MEKWIILNVSEQNPCSNKELEPAISELQVGQLRFRGSLFDILANMFKVSLSLSFLCKLVSGTPTGGCTLWRREVIYAASPHYANFWLGTAG
jgi:hypothetical protein